MQPDSPGRYETTQAGKTPRVLKVKREMTDQEYAQYQMDKATMAQQEQAMGAEYEADAPPRVHTAEEFHAAQNRRVAKRADRLKNLTVYEQILHGTGRDGDPNCHSRDERMMAKHKQQEAMWQQHRRYISERLNRPEDQLVVSKAEEFREKVELFDLLERATPVGIKSGGYGWYHSLRNDGSRHVQVGNMFSGLSYLMKMKKENYVDELVRKDRLAELGKMRKEGHDQPKTWRDDEYLVARLRRYRSQMNDMAPGRLDYDETLYVDGKPYMQPDYRSNLNPSEQDDGVQAWQVVNRAAEAFREEFGRYVGHCKEEEMPQDIGMLQQISETMAQNFDLSLDVVAELAHDFVLLEHFRALVKQKGEEMQRQWAKIEETGTFTFDDFFHFLAQLGYEGDQSELWNVLVTRRSPHLNVGMYDCDSRRRWGIIPVQEGEGYKSRPKSEKLVSNDTKAPTPASWIPGPNLIFCDAQPPERHESIFEYPDGKVVRCVDTLEFVTAKGGMASKDVILKNVGTTVVYFEWQHAKRDPQLSESVLPSNPTEYFHCVCQSGKLLPGEEQLCTFVFRSNTAGSFHDTWHLAPKPDLKARLHDLQLYAVCTTSDPLAAERERFAKQMREEQLEHQVHEMVNDVVLRVRTATPPAPDFNDPKVQEKIFEQRNAKEGLYWSPFVWDELHALLPKIRKYCKKFHRLANMPKDPKAKQAEPEGPVGLDPEIFGDEEGNEPQAQVLNLDNPDPNLDLHTFEWDHSVDMLLRELHACAADARDRTREELVRLSLRIQRHAKVRPAQKSPAWNPAYEAVLAMIDELPTQIYAKAGEFEVQGKYGPFGRPFASPDTHTDEERAARLKKWEEKRAPALEKAVAAVPALAEEVAKAQAAVTKVHEAALAKAQEIVASAQEALASSPDSEAAQDAVTRAQETLAATEAGGPEKADPLTMMSIASADPFVNKFSSLTEEATEAAFRTALLSSTPNLIDTFQAYLNKVNTEAEIGGQIVLYELDLAYPTLEIAKDGSVNMDDAAMDELSKRLDGLQEVLDAGCQAIFVVGHLGEHAEVATDPTKPEEKWDNAASPGNVCSIADFYDIASGRFPSVEWLSQHEFLNQENEPLPGLRDEDNEGRIYFVENLNYFYEETGYVRLDTGDVRRLPWAEREGFAQSKAWPFKPEFYIQDSFAVAANTTYLTSNGLWNNVPMRIVGPYVEAELGMLRELLRLTPQKEIKDEDEDDEEKAEEPQSAGPMLILLGGGQFDTAMLQRKLEILRGISPLVSNRVCLGGELGLYVLEAYLNIKTGLVVPPALRATLREYIEILLQAGAQLYLPTDVVCAYVAPPPDPEKVAARQALEAEWAEKKAAADADPNLPPVEPLPEEPQPDPVIKVSIVGQLKRAADELEEAKYMEDDPAAQKRMPALDAARGWFRVPLEEEAAVEVDDSWLGDSRGPSPDGDSAPAENGGIPEHYVVRDIGAETTAAWKELMRLSRGVFWNGTMGKCDEPEFAEGTKAMLEYVEYRYENPEDEEEEDEDEDEEEEEEVDDDGFIVDEDGNHILDDDGQQQRPREKPPKPPPPPPSIEFECTVIIGTDIGRAAEAYVNTELLSQEGSYFSLAEPIMELFRGVQLPGLANLADKPPVKEGK